MSDRQERVLRLMARREKLAMGRKAQEVAQLGQQHQQAEALLTRLEALREQHRADLPEIGSAGALRRVHWHGILLSEQSDMATNTASFLQTEMTRAREDLAGTERRLDLYEEAARKARRDAQDAREEMALRQMPPRRRRD